MEHGGNSGRRSKRVAPRPAGSGEEVWALIDADRERFPLELRPLPDATTTAEAKARWPGVLENHRRVIAMLEEHQGRRHHTGADPAK
jgi:hypothetical protein